MIIEPRRHCRPLRRNASASPEPTPELFQPSGLQIKSTGIARGYPVAIKPVPFQTTQASPAIAFLTHRCIHQAYDCGAIRAPSKVKFRLERATAIARRRATNGFGHIRKTVDHNRREHENPLKRARIWKRDLVEFLYFPSRTVPSVGHRLPGSGDGRRRSPPVLISSWSNLRVHAFALHVSCQPALLDSCEPCSAFNNLWAFLMR